MRILIVTPAPAGSRTGNRITALRWARLLREDGHRVELATSLGRGSYDLLVALHARKSAAAVRRAAEWKPAIPVVLALTGTDVCGALPSDSRSLRSLEVAARIVVLQRAAVARVPRSFRSKVRVIVQSAAALGNRPRPLSRVFEVVVVGHLRAVKDPFRTALAARLLPADSRIRVVHCGRALTPAMEHRALAEMRRNRRYVWLGERPHWQVRRRIARARLMVLSSRLEGGANVLSEALADGVAVLATRIPGCVGLLGDDYPGYFDVGDTQALAQLLNRAETDAAFLHRLKRHVRRRAALVQPEREKRCWQKLLQELFPADASRLPQSRRTAKLSR